VRDERDLYSTPLLGLLREVNPGLDIAVLARGGPEIDGHLEQLRKYGAEVQPDITIYQWCVNDMEFAGPLESSHGPYRLWRKLFLNEVLGQLSYLWYLSDFALNRLLPAPERHDPCPHSGLTPARACGPLAGTFCASPAQRSGVRP